MGKVFSERKIHIVSSSLLMLLYISVGVLIYSWLETHGNNLKNINHDHWAFMLTIATASTFAVAIFGTLVIASGLYYLTKLNDASSYYRNLNIATGVLLMLGGCGIGLLFTLYLTFNE